MPQYRIVWNDGSKWNARQVTQRTLPFSLAGGGTKMIPIARPRMVAHGDSIYYIFRDVERGSRVSLAYTDAGPSGEWKVADLTDFAVDAWEPSLDSSCGKAHAVCTYSCSRRCRATVNAWSIRPISLSTCLK